MTRIKKNIKYLLRIFDRIFLKYFNCNTSWFVKKLIKPLVFSKRTGVTHLYKNDCYYGHLSIYNFATQFIKGRKVLDAGSGMGYGSAYLAKNGAFEVVGLELSQRSVKFSRKHFKLPNLIYQQMDLQRIEGIKHHQFDVIFSSNVLEHLPNVSGFLHSACELIKKDGIFIMAVPPITNNIERIANLSIEDHLNIWSPKQWHHALQQYFNKIDCYIHNLEKAEVTLNLDNSPEETRINERDFSFRKISIDDFGEKNLGLTAIFLASQPVIIENNLSPEKTLSFVDQSFSRNLDNKIIKIEDHAALTDITVSNGTNLGPLSSGNRYCQKFVAKNNNLMAISLFVATYCKQIDSVARLFVLNSDGSELIREKNINTKEFFDNTWQPFFFQPIADSKGKLFLFCIETTGEDDAITLWTNYGIKGICKKNGELIRGAICFRSYYQEFPCNIIAPKLYR
jgi:2-polyprenyl-3-methyl-5-hydroxy-6-metoxy-1,4-benzoquinol methylase